MLSAVIQYFKFSRCGDKLQLRPTFDWDETQIAYYVPIKREDASAERFRQAVIRQVLERLRELEEVPAALIGRIKKLKGA